MPARESLRETLARIEARRIRRALDTNSGRRNTTRSSWRRVRTREKLLN